MLLVKLVVSVGSPVEVSSPLPPQTRVSCSTLTPCRSAQQHEPLVSSQRERSTYSDGNEEEVEGNVAGEEEEETNHWAGVDEQQQLQ